MSRLGRWSVACVLLLAVRAAAQPPTDLPPASSAPAVVIPPPAAAEPSPFPPAPLEGTASHAEGGHPSLLFTGDFFAWAPRRRGQDYAIVGTNPNWGVLGTIKTVEGDYDPGFRILAGYRFGEGYEAMFGYTYWNSRARDAVQAPAGQTVFPTLTHPALVIRTSSARAENSINMNVFDVEFARRLQVSEGVNARVHAGARFATLDQKFAADYSGIDVASSSVRRKLTFEGGGLRAGGEASFGFWENWGLFVRGSGSLMTGRFRSGLTEVSNGLTIVNATERFNKVVPTLDMGVGLSYQFGSMLKVSVGYEFHNWFGAVEGFDFVDDAHPAKMARRAADLGFDGMFFRAEMAF